jgi:hypothetical protein
MLFALPNRIFRNFAPGNLMLQRQIFSGYRFDAVLYLFRLFLDGNIRNGDPAPPQRRVE